MEDFKDVMLSEPPQRFATNNVPTASNALSLESYKGILLCDRPTDTRVARTSSQAPFLPPGNTDMDRGNGNLGLQPSIEARARNASTKSGRSDLQARTKNTALSRHRKWLQSFATEMKKMKEAHSEQQILQSVKDATLRDREAAKRRQPRSADATADHADTDNDVDEAAAAPAVNRSVQKKPSQKSNKAKPKWAMTEEEAEENEFDEARDLMDFVADLDFDTFMKDFEVQEALAIMRDRVREIAAEKGIDIDAERARRRDADEVSVTSSVARATGRPAGARGAAASRSKPDDAAPGDDRPAWDDSTGTAIRRALQGDALRLAERVLQSSDDLRKVHSKMSMAKLLEDVAMEVNAGKSQRQVMLPSECVVVPPKIAMVAADATGDHHSGAAQPTKRVLTEMRHSKSQAQNLPYLYRCPSI